MKDFMMGEFTQDIIENGLFLPEKFHLNNCTVSMVVLQEKNWVSIQLHQNLTPETLEMLKEEHITILSSELIEITENGFLLLPSSFLEYIGPEQSVVVTGMMDCVEILTLKEMNELKQNMDELESVFEELWG